MSNMISASSATAPNRTDDAPERTPLQQLIDRCEAASARMSASNPNRALLADLAVAVVSLAKMNADLLSQQAEKPRIILPG